MSVNFMAIWNILCPFWYIALPFENFVVIWYIFPLFGILNNEKSGNLALIAEREP
jgi:hypothetical protein